MGWKCYWYESYDDVILIYFVESIDLEDVFESDCGSVFFDEIVLLL